MTGPFRVITGKITRTTWSVPPIHVDQADVPEVAREMIRLDAAREYWLLDDNTVTCLYRQPMSDLANIMVMHRVVEMARLLAPDPERA